MHFYNILSLLASVVLLLSCNKKHIPASTVNKIDSASVQTVPAGGNTWITANTGKGGEHITEKGITEWTSAGAVFTSYIKFAHAGTLHLSLKASIRSGESIIQVTINNEHKNITVSGDSFKDYYAGTWKIKEAGYTAIRIRGLKKTSSHFPEVTSLGISGTAADDKTVYVKSNEGNFFYWGRRGPSTHVNYQLPEKDNVEWFYNEVTVPVGYDPVGSYYMADGFSVGYFGMQVNSPSERRILFSVWSPYETDNPGNIPDSLKIMLLKKGTGVKTGEFGNEGSGGQSYLLYNWTTGNTYKFLLHAKPESNNYTTFTAYFFVPEKNEWILIASFRRPQTNTFIQKPHSFLESFEPETGNRERKVYFNNQWVKYSNGKWQELTTMKFTADATARKKYRLDYEGGTESSKGFFLHNCGFFNQTTAIDTIFNRHAEGNVPDINTSLLK